MPNSAAGKELQQFYFKFVDSPGAQAGHVKRCNALVSLVILYNGPGEVFTFPGLFRMESMWNPWNPSEIPYGIHGMNVG